MTVRFRQDLDTHRYKIIKLFVIVCDPCSAKKDNKKIPNDNYCTNKMIIKYDVIRYDNKVIIR